MYRQRSKSKSPLTLLMLIAFLIISTLVVISNYFLRPGLELDLKNRITTKLYSYNVFNPVVKVEGRDVVLKGIAADLQEAIKIETEIQNISGIHQLENKLVIESLIEPKQSDQNSNN